jgi:formylglycine-generating enzyme required for sulfatase activity
MKSFSSPKKWACVCAATLSSIAALNAGMVYETELDFVTTGDFNGDGQLDIALIDRNTGRVRVGYRLSSEFFNWADWRAGGPKDQYTSVSVGKITDPKFDSLALSAADANLITVLNAADPNVPSDPLPIPGTAIGPNTIVAVDVGGPGNTPLLDLYVSSIYNADPTPNRATLFRNAANQFTQAAELAVTGTESRGNRLALKTGGPEYLVVLSSGETGNVLRADRLDSGKPVEVLTIPGLPSGVDYVAGNFSGGALKEFVFYAAGETELRVSKLEETGGGFKSSALKTITLARPVRQLVTMEGEKKSRLLAVFGDQEPAEILDFDGENAPVTVQQLAGATNRFLNLAVALPDAVALFSTATNDRPRPAEYYQVHVLKDGSFVPAAFGTLASLADRDEFTVPLIYTNIIARSLEKTAADMKTYTNMIPGTDVPYQMVAIPGGEFTMGSPESEKDRLPDEGPQHKVKLSPFWMGQFEVTWDQYLLFMYPDDEKKLRETHKTDATINEVSDAVTRPSKPYVDMSFGMGKSGFPAIAMTHHAANKFCHWLSAKTGHFYRLPTEAEWEYACRAGTTTAYSYGDDPNKLPDYGWFFDNSNSKYQRVGKKKPNPWNLYDMHGNVVEWTLDQHDAGIYAKNAAQGVIADPWNRATQPYPHSLRGGSWDDDPQQLRSAARRGSDRSLKATDPQLPKGIWYLTDGQVVGFRVVRPLAIPQAEEMTKYWISGVEKD